MKKRTHIIEEIRNALMTQADMCKHMADRITDDPEAKPMDAFEKAQIREVMAGSWLRRMQNESRYFFAEGNMADYEKTIYNTAEILEYLV